MPKVFVVGIGPGNADYIMPKAVEIMDESDVIIGFSRALDSLNFISSKKIKVFRLSEIIELVNSTKYKTISVAASGDPLFYGITDYLKKNYGENIEVVPGISSFQYMMSKLKMNWQNSYLGSVHGRNAEIVHIVQHNELSIWLTDNCNSPDVIGKKLYKNHIDALVYVGEDLSYASEKITAATPDKIMNMEFNKLSVVVIKNQDILKKGEC
ncbi:precorrin-6y C5,15-methyltransferase (decarboxylating) subunit CbiE [Clostridium tyrobutyricum]|uniref:precorrin-6y C5,15-methyltransferase (decarboxylating) subunit CbiE n=1 Tax=Clostridium tyrobutyricum TaxID=1519 RepID=UPI001C380316|nr:precorrin-6y C5,15-methyltransferase (decarboxylating) subunit CbiE [Clostridium tyrobutyricum]